MRPIRLWMTVALAAACVMEILTAQSAPAQTYNVLYSFTGGADGAYPFAGVIRDAKGNLYGTTVSGGDLSCGGGQGCGAVFRVSQTGKETVLYSFKGGADGTEPYAGVIRDIQGNLYGTATFDGDLKCNLPYGCGIVFKLSKTNKETVLYRFKGGTDGALPNGVIQDVNGNLYGTTSGGGDLKCNAPYGCGVVFKLSTTGKETVLYRFKGGSDGAYPDAGVIWDPQGNLYGTTNAGGNSGCFSQGCGTVFKINAKGKETVLYIFSGGADGASPSSAGLSQDAKGSLYGTTYDGGDLSCGEPYGCGVVFKLSKTGKETVLYSFKGSPDAFFPAAGVIQDSKSNLYGMTIDGVYGFGTVFEVSGSGQESQLHNFNGSDGGGNFGALVRDAQGNLYGTGQAGPDGHGVVFKLTP